MEDGEDAGQDYAYPDIADMDICNGGRITNTLRDESVVGRFNLAVSNSPLNQKDAIEEAIEQVVVEGENGYPTLKPEIKKKYKDSE